MTYEIRVRLILWNAQSDEMDPCELRDNLGLDAPSRTWLKGDRLDQRTARTHKDNGLLYLISRTFDGDPVQEIDKLIARLDVRGESARQAILKNRSEVSLVIRIYLSGEEEEPMVTPSFHMPRETIAKLHSYGLDLDFDLYVLDKDANRGSFEWSKLLPEGDAANG